MYGRCTHVCLLLKSGTKHAEHVVSRKRKNVTLKILKADGAALHARIDWGPCLACRIRAGSQFSLGRW